MFITTQDRIKVGFALLLVVENVADTRHAVPYVTGQLEGILLCCVVPQSVPRAAESSTDTLIAKATLTMTLTLSPTAALRRPADQLRNDLSSSALHNILLYSTLLFICFALFEYAFSLMVFSICNGWFDFLSDITDLACRNLVTR